MGTKKTRAPLVDAYSEAGCHMWFVLHRGDLEPLPCAPGGLRRAGTEPVAPEGHMQPRKMAEEELDEVLASLPLRDAAKVRRHINALEAEAARHNFQARVREFNVALGDLLPAAPDVPPEDKRKLRCALLLEEVLEFIKGSGCRVDVSRGRIEVVAVGRPDLVNMAQELADVVYVALNNANTLGVSLADVVHVVHSANMAKVGPDGAVVRREDGKVLKPEGWQPPDVAAVLARQGWRQK